MLQALFSFIITVLGGKCKDEDRKENRDEKAKQEIDKEGKQDSEF
jgi:hypothetical protein